MRPLNYYLEAMRFFDISFIFSTRFCFEFLILIIWQYSWLCDIVINGFLATKWYLIYIFVNSISDAMIILIRQYEQLKTVYTVKVIIVT